MQLPPKSVIELMAIHHKGKNKTYVRTKTCTQMLLAASFMIAQNGNSPNVLPQMTG